MTETQTLTESLLNAALAHVVFDGWSQVSFDAAIRDTCADPVVANAILPRGAVDLALAFHRRADEAMRIRLAQTDLDALRFRDRVALAVRYRLEAVAADKEAVRRGVTLFAQPRYAVDGAQALWGTADAIWDALGDRSQDVNWYTKRASLSAVYSATLLYWLGDESPSGDDSWAFLDRRIAEVMTIEKFKSDLRNSAILKPFLAGPNWLSSVIKAPDRQPKQGMPGSQRG